MRRSTTDGPAAPRLERSAAPPDEETHASGATLEPGSSGWGAIAIVVVPLGAVFTMVAALIVANAVDHWWALVLAMLLDLVAILLVVATVARMLAGDE